MGVALCATVIALARPRQPPALRQRPTKSRSPRPPPWPPPEGTCLPASLPASPPCLPPSLPPPPLSPPPPLPPSSPGTLAGGGASGQAPRQCLPPRRRDHPHRPHRHHRHRPCRRHRHVRQNILRSPFLLPTPPTHPTPPRPIPPGPCSLPPRPPPPSTCRSTPPHLQERSWLAHLPTPYPPPPPPACSPRPPFMPRLGGSGGAAAARGRPRAVTGWCGAAVAGAAASARGGRERRPPPATPSALIKRPGEGHTGCMALCPFAPYPHRQRCPFYARLPGVSVRTRLLPRSRPFVFIFPPPALRTLPSSIHPSLPPPALSIHPVRRVCAPPACQDDAQGEA